MTPRDKNDNEIRVGQDATIRGVVELAPDEHTILVRVSSGLSVWVATKSVEVTDRKGNGKDHDG